MNSNDTLARDLRHHYLFSALDESQHVRVLEHAHPRNFAAGELLFSQGDTAHHLFLLQSGTVKLYRISPEGQEKIMRLIRPGQSFAESVMFMDKPHYPVHGTGIEPGILIAIERGTFLTILQESFDTCRAVMAQMTQRIQAHWDEIEALTLQNSRYRVVHYLLGLISMSAHGATSIMLPARKIVISAQLAITPETFSRVLRALSDEGLINVHDETVHIFDVDKLRKSIH